MDIIGKITDVKILQQGRGGLNGLVIEFETNNKITKTSVVQIRYEDSLKPFNVSEIEIVGDKLLGRAVECGYFAHKLEKKADLDIRDLIGYEVELVTDEKRLSSINEASCWC